jgi:tetraacyldisaccharide 4'-kinase
MAEAALHRWLQSRWYGDKVPLALRPAAALFSLLVSLRRVAYRLGWLSSRHPGVPVVVVGNLTVGGTGKTPVVIWLAQHMREAGLRVGIVLRGYGVRVRSPRLVSPLDDASSVGDEAMLLAKATGCAVAVGADRVAAAALLADAGCDLVVADDGLQHLALRHDLAIVVVDGERGFGNGALLPAGPMREPARRLAQVDFVVVQGEDRRHVAPAGALRLTLLPHSLTSVDGQHERSLDSLRSQQLHAVAGIGNPGRFFAQLRALGAQPVEHAFADHHRYRAADLAFDDDHLIVMTAKDAVKCRAFATARMWCLNVSATLPAADAGRLLGGVTAMVTQRGPERA